MEERIKVLLADSEQVFREGLALLLQNTQKIEIVHQSTCGDDAIEKTKETKPHVVLVDSKISECSLLDTVEQITKSSPEVKVVVITRHYEENDPFAAIDAGARGILAKDISVDDLVKSVELIASGRVVISPHFSNQFLDEVTSLRQKAKDGSLVDIPLSKREIEILKLIAIGATNKEVSETLCVSENTVKTHVRNIVNKLELRNRQQLVAFAIARGIVK